jgi:hypothetical protein
MNEDRKTPEMRAQMSDIDRQRDVASNSYA